MCFFFSLVIAGIQRQSPNGDKKRWTYLTSRQHSNLCIPIIFMCPFLVGFVTICLHGWALAAPMYAHVTAYSIVAGRVQFGLCTTPLCLYKCARQYVCVCVWLAVACSTIAHARARTHHVPTLGAHACLISVCFFFFQYANIADLILPNMPHWNRCQ